MIMLDRDSHEEKSLSEIGTESKILLGKQTDNELLQHVRDNPGMTMSDLSRSLRWTIGKVQGAITRLEKSKQITLEKVLRDERVVSLIYPSGKRFDPGVVKIDKDLLSEPEKWNSLVNIYALNRSAIVVTTPDASSNLEKNAFQKLSVVPEDKEDHFIITLPESFINFYQLNNSDIDIASNGKSVFVTVNFPIKAIVSEKDQGDDLPLDYKLLILEDDKAYARTLRSGLYKYFTKIDLSSSEGDAKEKIVKENPHYIILDWDIANKKAAERILRWMKNTDKDIPAAIITSQDYEEGDERRFKEEGFDAFYDKVTNQLPKVLSSHIIRTLKSKQGHG